MLLSTLVVCEERGERRIFLYAAPGSPTLASFSLPIHADAPALYRATEHPVFPFIRAVRKAVEELPDLAGEARLFYGSVLLQGLRARGLISASLFCVLSLLSAWVWFCFCVLLPLLLFFLCVLLYVCVCFCMLVCVEVSVSVGVFLLLFACVCFRSCLPACCAFML